MAPFPPLIFFLALWQQHANLWKPLVFLLAGCCTRVLIFAAAAAAASTAPWLLFIDAVGGTTDTPLQPGSWSCVSPSRACFRAENVVNNSLALRADLEEDVVLMTSLILAKTQGHRGRAGNCRAGKVAAIKAGQMQSKSSERPTKKFAGQNQNRKPKTQNQNASRNASVTSIQVPRSRPFCCWGFWCWHFRWGCKLMRQQDSLSPS